MSHGEEKGECCGFEKQVYLEWEDELISEWIDIEYLIYSEIETIWDRL